jgi:hypothetical protein
MERSHDRFPEGNETEVPGQGSEPKPEVTDTAAPNGPHADLNESEGAEEQPNTSGESLDTAPQLENREVDDDPGTGESNEPFEGAPKSEEHDVEDDPEPSEFDGALEKASSTGELKRAAWTEKLKKCGRRHSESILEFASTLHQAKKELSGYHFQKAVVDAGLTINIANKYLPIAKCERLYSPEMKPILPYLDGYTSISKLSGFNPAQFDQLIENWKQKPFRVTREELCAIKGEAERKTLKRRSSCWQLQRCLDERRPSKS